VLAIGEPTKTLLTRRYLWKGRLRMRVRTTLLLPVLPVFFACDTLARSSSGRDSSAREPGRPSSVAQGAPSADTSRAEVRLLRRYGWTPVQLLAEDTLQLPEPVPQYLQTRRYLEASEMVGLDFSSHAGRRLRLTTYGVQGHSAPAGSVRAHLLWAEGGVVGAWLSVEERTPGIYPLSFDPYAL